jgi:hypothetical protein
MIFTVGEGAGSRRFIDISSVDQDAEIVANPTACAKLIMHLLIVGPGVVLWWQG